MSLDLPRPYDKAVEIVTAYGLSVTDDAELVQAVAEAIQEPRLMAMNIDNELYWLKLFLDQVPSAEHLHVLVGTCAELKGHLDMENPDIEKLREIMAECIKDIDELPRRKK